MTPQELHQQMEQARGRIQELQEELGETQRGLLAMTMELEQRVEQRTVSLQASQAQLQTTLENLSEGVMVSDPDGNIIHWNRAGLAMHGFARQEEGLGAVAAFTGMFELSALDGSVLKLEHWPLPRLLHGEALRDWEIRIRRLRDGWQRIFSYSGSLVHDAQGQPLLAVLSISDVTERRQAEEQARLRAAALEAAANGIAITDPQGTILWVNQAFCELTGYGRAELVGRNHRILKSGQQDENFYQQMWATIRRGEIWHGELVNCRKDGRLYVDEQTIAPLRDGSGAILNFIAVKRDVTERKAHQEALAAAKISAEHAKAAAEEASRAKDHFLAVLSHELRTPLTPVVAALSILQRQQAGFDLETREHLEMIRRNVDLEARLIDDLLDVTRIEKGKIELDRKPIMLCEVLRRAVEVCQSDIAARRLEFGMDAEDFPCIVNADATRLQQVFWNLLRNAVKFTPTGGCIGIRCRRRDGTAIVEVNDSGEGIDPQALTRIFNAFEQAERSITRQFGGLGLGLAISKALVEMHGGTIEAFSEGRGKGACFRVRLPLVVAEPTVEAPPAVAPPIARPLRILLVEDHGDTARIMRQLLMRHGHQVEHAGDVATALEMAGKHAFDLLVSDLGLPDASGLELIRQLRARGQTFPAIALSGYGQEEEIRRSRGAGFAVHLVKPTDPAKLAEAIATLSGQK